MLHNCLLIILSTFLFQVRAQQPGSLVSEIHPSLTWQKCVSRGSCTVQMGKIVLDANWRWYHTQFGRTENCFSGNEWAIAQYCPNLPSCKYTYVVEGVDDYSGNYGVTTSGNSLTLRFVTPQAYSPNPNIGSRVYFMKDDNTYEKFNPLAQEFTFDVDMSNLPCGIAADAHFSDMEADGGMAQSAGWNSAGAKYGTGYCDARCPRDLKWVNGV
ncbi:hypothetical protein FRC01_013426, partial [Tulasnella sp. 417]